MNIVDIVILAILGLCVIYGFYRGFVHTVLNLACLIAAIFLAFMFSPQLASAVRADKTVASALTTYTDAVARVGDYDLASTSVENLSPSLIDTVLDNVNLPEQIEAILRANLSGRAFQSVGLNNVNDYVQNTVVAVAINVLSFIACFIVAYALLSIVVSLIRHVFRYPILKQLDWLAGGLFGLLRGGLLLYVLFLLVPILSTVIPLDQFNVLLSQSTLAPLFTSDGFFAGVIAGKLF